ncbi:MAG: DNA polymerase III subunit gamma/tau [Lachnospiraceae bacterium]|nr:DNA polymerase III subunit gamma/tau [Lachnospiraceae bacterium]
MSYQALYRKFRPTTYSDVKGQEHIVQTLKNQLKADRLGHAYLFCGTRGTGKTTVAKIFAKAVNCEHPVDGEPCGECNTCKAISKGISMNVVEMDAASNNGVDNVREIIEQTTYTPTEGKYKVFIIDEVHMLSTAAFNALLKTLEEPPSYVIFVLATTEKHKIPITVLSRCQQYDFHRMTIDTIKNRMQELLLVEGASVTDDALLYIARAADGSMRDALSLLDQCMAFYMDKEVTLDNVLEVLGAVDNDVFTHLLSAIEARDVNKCLEVISDVVMQGRDLSQFVVDFTWYMRNLLLIKNGDHMGEVLDMSAATVNELKEIATNISSGKIIRYIRILSELSGEMRYSNQKRIQLEVAAIKLCRPQMEQNTDSIIDRLNQIEETLVNGHPLSALEKQGEEAVKEAIASAPKPAIKRAQLPKAIPEDIKKVVSNFRSIVSEYPSGLAIAYLKGAKLNLAGDKLQLVFEDTIGFTYFKDEDNCNILKDLISERCGKQVEIEVTFNDTNRPYEDSYVDLEKLVNMEITIEDEE